ncbi:RluA family pseudouridine synthase [Magnetospirillum gryphiswaldense]|uniref:Pseudouridylate synthase n=1 Tax=Magnetospirillum gryphiswaldense TaxID=55518 RepID=A4TY94_9PROT|nr:RNA pseudouridine synthase [Magnetospirillum gryphiswaldense]AVM75198.1 Ribosomal large subunit pseudouridine synthase C [Magnetospirillum gryphiswaldense MSR-1]AVM79101.1 Ribosomal large subunit pseudouridine synthase C [Magnetospirillum gryphiswaldense]CAM75601.1 Pseudouridylate synthase [Magnetospirillum gryphiswaldense MSR-1]
MTEDEIKARILFKDQDVIVLDKPAGLAVHAGPNSPDHLELYLDALKFGWSMAPRLAHRLDRDTSGCLLLGRHDKSIKRLGKMFMQGRVEKAYWTVVHGTPPEDTGEISAPIHKVTGKGGWRIIIDAAGQPAVTRWRVLGRGDGLSWIECTPLTGRTHQIRVHMKHLGCPVRGDVYYGPDPESELGLHLQSHAIGVPPLSTGKDWIRAEAPPPPHMVQALFMCGWIG